MLEEDDSEDSLELLLDTLCNAFGGIILITLLIALMSQEAHDAVAAPKNYRTQALIEEQKIVRLDDEIVIEQTLVSKAVTASAELHDQVGAVHWSVRQTFTQTIDLGLRLIP